MRVLLVEDDPMIGAAVRTHLLHDRCQVDWVRDPDAAEEFLSVDPYDVVLLDLGLPKRDGLQVLSDLRKRDNNVPVLIMTARDAVSDRIEGLDAGADDYVVKPFDAGELAARMRAVVRRKGGRAAPVIEHGGVTLDPATHRVTRDGVEVPISPREYALLAALLERPGAILSRAQLEARMYGWSQEIESNAVEVHIHSLRRKLGAEFIRNVRGVGYRV